MQGTVTVDGSGLDLGNRVTCDLLTAVLDHAGPDSVLAHSLPVAGRTGTLRFRLAGTVAEGRVAAKTGTLDEVNALAGFAHSLSGQVLTFAFVINGTSPTRPGPARPGGRRPSPATAPGSRWPTSRPLPPGS